MSPEPVPVPVRDIIEAWREHWADAPQPWRFQLIDALARRAEEHTGAARQWLDSRLSELMAMYAEDLADAQSRAAEPANIMASPTPLRGPLGELAEQLAHRQPLQSEVAEPGQMEARGMEGGASDPADLPALDTFRKTWSRLRSQSQFRQVQRQPPADAGPLNSAALVHRSMALMRELSPEYLKHFLAYIDDLSWMEQLAGGTSSTPVATRPGNGKKRARSKAKPVPQDQ